MLPTPRRETKSQENDITHSNDPSGAVATLDCLSPFTPSRWWPGGWLQTISLKAMRPELDVDAWPGSESIKITDDGNPPDTLTGYFLPPNSASAGKPIVIVFHGMGGHARSRYTRSLAVKLLAEDYPVVLWNNRGAGSSRDTCTRFHHPGKTDDIQRLVTFLRDEKPEWSEHGLHMAAFSLGGNPMLKYLAEQGERCPITAAVSVSAPLDMEITSRNLRQGVNRLFDKYLLKRQCDELLRPNAKLSDAERAAINSARSVWELDDQFTAKRFDLEGAAAYYRKNSACYSLDDIRTPTLLIHATDDPVVDTEVFSQRDWTDEGPLFAALAESGGHTGFVNRSGGRWHEECAVRFFQWRSGHVA